MCCTRLAGNTGCKNDAKKSPTRHYRSTLSACIFATKAYIDNRKKRVKQQYLSTRPRNMSNFGGQLTAEIGSGVWGTPVNFNGFRVLAALLHGTLVVGVSQTLRRWTEGATYIRQGGHGPSRWALAHILLVLGLVSSLLRQEAAWEKRLRNDLFCVELNVKPYLDRSVDFWT